MKAYSFVLVTAALAACGGQVAQPIDGGATADASSTSDATPPKDAAPPPTTVDATTACNDVAPLASMITPTLVAQSPPPVANAAPPPANGTYYAESATVYTGTNGTSGPGEPAAITLRIDPDGVTWHTVTVDKAETTRRSYSITKQALNYALVTTCGGTVTTPVTFIAISSPGFVMRASSGNVGSDTLFRPFKK